LPSSKYGFENGHFPVFALYHFNAVSIGGLPRAIKRPRTEGSAKMRFQQLVGMGMLVLLVGLGLLVVGLQYVPHRW
jgi:hypothetical protein